MRIRIAYMWYVVEWSTRVSCSLTAKARPTTAGMRSKKKTTAGTLRTVSQWRVKTWLSASRRLHAARQGERPRLVTDDALARTKQNQTRHVRKNTSFHHTRPSTARIAAWPGAPWPGPNPELLLGYDLCGVVVSRQQYLPRYQSLPKTVTN